MCLHVSDVLAGAYCFDADFPSRSGMGILTAVGPRETSGSRFGAVFLGREVVGRTASLCRPSAEEVAELHPNVALQPTSARSCGGIAVSADRVLARAAW